MDDDLSEQLSKHFYKILEIVARGGSCICLRVESLKYRADFACKVITLSNQEKANCSYNAEVELLKNLQSPYIVNIYDCFVEENNYYIILEYCHFHSLREYSKTTKLRNSEIMKYMLNISLAVEYLHSLNIAHHDIKPANFFLDQYYRAKLGDFGIAKKYEHSEKSTKAECTLKFAAPELLKGIPYDPFKADIWSLGVSIYYLSTGNYPFIGHDHKTILKSISSGIFDVPTKMSSVLRSIISQCLNPAPENRPTATQIVEILKKNQQVSQKSSVICQVPKMTFTSSASLIFRRASKPTMVKPFSSSIQRKI